MNGLSSISEVNARERIAPAGGVSFAASRVQEEKDDKQKVGEIASRGEAQVRGTTPAEDGAHPDPDSVTVARSIDGDTTRASRSALENLREGMVFKKTEAGQPSDVRQTQNEANNISLRPQPEDALQTGNEKGAGEAKEERPITSMTGYTDTQVDQLYRRGEISRQDYDQEMERRERIDEAAGLKEEETNPVVDSAKEASAKEVMEEQTEKIQEEEKEAAAGTGRPEDNSRVDEQRAEEKKQLITEEIENNEEFISTMGQVSAEKQDFSLRADAVMDSLAAGREELMQQVLEAADKVAATEPTQ